MPLSIDPPASVPAESTRPMLPPPSGVDGGGLEASIASTPVAAAPRSSAAWSETVCVATVRSHAAKALFGPLVKVLRQIAADTNGGAAVQRIEIVAADVAAADAQDIPPALSTAVALPAAAPMPAANAGRADGRWEVGAAGLAAPRAAPGRCTPEAVAEVWSAAAVASELRDARRRRTTAAARQHTLAQAAAERGHARRRWGGCAVALVIVAIALAHLDMLVIGFGRPADAPPRTDEPARAEAPPRPPAAGVDAPIR